MNWQLFSLNWPDFGSSFILGLIFLIVAQVLKEKGLGKRFDDSASELVDRLQSRGQKRGAEITKTAARGLSNVVTVIYYLVLALFLLSALSLFLSVLPVLQDAMAKMVDFYWANPLEFVSLMVTASSVLLGFAFAAETVIGAGQVNSAITQLKDRTKTVKILGLACLVSSFAALVLNGTGDVARAKGALELAVVLLFLETGYAAILAT